LLKTNRAYDPAAFRDLPVSTEIKDIFKFIERYQPQNIELDFKLKPFIPDYIPSIGDIDAFIKVFCDLNLNLKLFIAIYLI
jgi:intraflagellar transport protein 46